MKGFCQNCNPSVFCFCFVTSSHNGCHCSSNSRITWSYGVGDVDEHVWGTWDWKPHRRYQIGWWLLFPFSLCLLVHVLPFTHLYPFSVFVSPLFSAPGRTVCHSALTATRNGFLWYPREHTGTDGNFRECSCCCGAAFGEPRTVNYDVRLIKTLNIYIYIVNQWPVKAIFRSYFG